MTDEVVVSAPVAAVEASPAPAPVVNASPEPLGSPQTAIQPTPVPEAPKTETPVSEPLKGPEAAPTESLLGEQPKADAPETPPTPEAKPAEGEAVQEKTEGQSDEPAPPPVYDPFTLPEGFEVDGEQLKKFTDVLGELEVKTKAEHAALQEFGQKAVDLYTNEVKSAVDRLNKHYETTWENTKNEWKETFLKDPELGGNRWQTTINAATNFIRDHGGNEEQQLEFRSLMNTSGLGNHPAMIRLLANAGKAMSEGRPLAAVKPESPPKSKVAAMYGKS